MDNDESRKGDCPYERKACPCVLQACHGLSFTPYQDYKAQGGTLDEREYWTKRYAAMREIYGSLPPDDPGPPGIPATPLLEPYQTYLESGGKLSEPQFWEALADIVRCQEMLCGLPAKGSDKTERLLGIWLSIWAEVHAEECFPGARSRARSSFLAGTQKKEEVFLRLVGLVHDLFCGQVDTPHDSDTSQRDR